MKYIEDNNFTAIQVKALNKVFEELNKNFFKYCVLRNFEKLPIYIGNDLDLLIDEKQLKPITETIIHIMCENDFEVSKKVERYGHLGLYFYHSKFKQIIVFDLLSRSLKIWYEYADSEYILNNVISYKNFFIPPKGSILFTVVFKDLLTYGYVRPKNNQLLKSISNNDEDSFIQTGKRFFSLRLLKNVYEDLKKNEVKTTKRHLFFELQFKIKINNIFKYIYFRAKEIIVK